MEIKSDASEFWVSRGGSTSDGLGVDSDSEDDDQEEDDKLSKAHYNRLSL
jgi:hypothetical protein